MEIKIYFDGGCDPSRHTGYGSYEIVGEGCNHKVSRMQHNSPQTSNTAEYLTLIAALKWLSHNCPDFNAQLKIYSDSLLVVNQVNGRWKNKTLHLRELAGEVHLLFLKYPKKPILTWQRRDANVARFGH